MCRSFKALALCAFALFVSGCAVGNKQEYATATPQVTLTTKRHIAVAVQDHRPYVVDHDKGEDFVGLQRGGFGNPFDVRTVSGHPMAADFRDVIVAALKRRDIVADSLMTSPSTAFPDITKAAFSSGADRFLFLRLDEWKADTATNTALIYDVHLMVLDQSGNQMAEVAHKGKDDLGGDFIDPPDRAKVVVPQAYQRMLESLLNDPKVTQALQ